MRIVVLAEHFIEETYEGCSVSYSTQVTKPEKPLNRELRVSVPGSMLSPRKFKPDTLTLRKHNSRVRWQLEWRPVQFTPNQSTKSVTHHNTNRNNTISSLRSNTTNQWWRPWLRGQDRRCLTHIVRLSQPPHNLSKKICFSPSYLET